MAADDDNRLKPRATTPLTTHPLLASHKPALPVYYSRSSGNDRLLFEKL